MQVLNEMYFGKVIALQQLEDTIEKIRIKYSINWINEITSTHRELNKDLLVQKISTYLKDQFGFGEVIVTISRQTQPNASTMTMIVDKNGNLYDKEHGTTTDLKNCIFVGPEGIRFDNRKIAPDILVIISMGMLLSSRITSAEIVAALLHEIGHSFSRATIGSNEFDVRIDEKFADQFATMYGYGSELNSVLSKIVNLKQRQSLESLRHIPIVNVFVGLNNIVRSVLGRVINTNVHPTLDRRMSDTIKQMEEDLKNTENLTKKQRDELKRNIEKANQAVAAFYGDKQDIPDRMYKYYLKNWESKWPKESRADRHAEQFGSSSLVHNKLLSLKKKGR